MNKPQLQLPEPHLPVSGKFLPNLLQKLKKLLTTPESSLKDYVKFGGFYIAKRLIVAIALLLCLLIYFVFINPPVFVDQLLHRDTALQPNTKKLATFTGPGKLTDPATKTTLYQGTFVDGLYSGQGIQYSPQHYQGAFKSGKFDGQGTLYFANGNVQYEGAFFNGLFEGQGKLLDDQGHILYQGGFHAGLKEGIGQLFNTDGSLSYSGSFLQDVPSGTGTSYDDKGRATFTGQYIAGVRSGSGILFDTLGNAIYQGYFSYNAPYPPALLGVFQNQLEPLLGKPNETFSKTESQTGYLVWSYNSYQMYLDLAPTPNFPQTQSVIQVILTGDTAERFASDFIDDTGEAVNPPSLTLISTLPGTSGAKTTIYQSGAYLYKCEYKAPNTPPSQITITQASNK